MFRLFSGKSRAKTGLLFTQVQLPLFPLFLLFCLFPSLQLFPCFTCYVRMAERNQMIKAWGTYLSLRLVGKKNELTQGNGPSGIAHFMSLLFKLLHRDKRQKTDKNQKKQRHKGDTVFSSVVQHLPVLLLVCLLQLLARWKVSLVTRAGDGYVDLIHQDQDSR